MREKWGCQLVITHYALCLPLDYAMDAIEVIKQGKLQIQSLWYTLQTLNYPMLYFVTLTSLVVSKKVLHVNRLN